MASIGNTGKVETGIQNVFSVGAIWHAVVDEQKDYNLPRFETSVSNVLSRTNIPVAIFFDAFLWS